MGTVDQCDVELDRQVALKVIEGISGAGESQLVRFQRKDPRKRYAGANQLAQAPRKFSAGEGPEQPTDNQPTGEE